MKTGNRSHVCRGKRGQNRSILFKRYCIFSANQHSSRLLMWPWTLPQHSSLISAQAEGCSDGSDGYALCKSPFNMFKVNIEQWLFHLHWSWGNDETGASSRLWGCSEQWCMDLFAFSAPCWVHAFKDCSMGGRYSPWEDVKTLINELLSTSHSLWAAIMSKQCL